jgi:hypothetical protein
VTVSASGENITVITVWFVHSKFTMLKDMILNMCSHEDDILTNSPLEEPTIQVPHISVPYTIINVL